jgi:hypothetical protein
MSVTVARILPERTTRRLPPYLSEFYEVAFNSDHIELPRATRTVTKRASPKKTRETLKSTASPKKKSPKKTSITSRPALATARDSFASSFTSSNRVAYNQTGVKGTEDRSKWALSTATIDSSYSIDDVLRGCYYHPGSIKPVAANHGLHSIEICFAFDTTGSMSSCINTLKQKLQAMMQQLVKDIPTIKISIMAVGDYCDATSSYVIQKLDFSNDIDILVGFVQSLSSTGGGDSEECYELALMEAQALNWTTGVDESMVTKCVVMIGDDLPHPKGTYLNIDWREQVVNLRDRIGAKIYSVQCLGRDRANEFYQTMADDALGQRFLLDNFGAMAELFMAVCYREATEHAEKNLNDDMINDDGSTIIRPNTGSSLSDEDIIKIHQTIHDSTQEKITIGDTVYDISIGNEACRFVRINDVTYIEQNKEKKTKYAKMALQGRHVTWITHSGQWGLIVDDEILRR